MFMVGRLCCLLFATVISKRNKFRVLDYRFSARLLKTWRRGGADFNLPPGMVYKWKQEFLQNAYHAMSTDSEQKAGEGKADRFKRKNEQMLIHWAAHTGA